MQQISLSIGKINLKQNIPARKHQLKIGRCFCGTIEPFLKMGGHGVSWRCFKMCCPNTLNKLETLHAISYTNHLCYYVFIK
jgi:hypothetical protein